VTRRDRWVVLGGAITLAVLATYAVLQLRVSTDISHFLPGADEARLAEISTQLAHSTLTRTVILSLEAPTPEESLSAARQLADALRPNPEIARLRVGPPDGFAEASYRLLFPHRYQLLFEHPEQEWPAMLTSEGIAAAASKLKLELLSPTGILLERIAGKDPLLAFPSLLERLEAVNSGALRVEDGQYLSQDGRHAILFVETKHSPFDGAVQAPFLEQVQAAFTRVNQDHGAALVLEQSSLSRYAVASEKIIRQDINRISGVSTLAIALLFLLLFRSARILVLSFVPLLFGIAAGIAASMAWFGEIHGLTLAFGSTLIGVCVDYPIHFLNHHSLIPSPDGPRGTLRRIRWALVLGAGTTLAGFVGLAGTTFPGMRELALFASAGIVAALAATYWLLPPLSAAVPPRVALHQACAEAAGRLLRLGAAHRRQLALLPLAALVLCAFGLPRVRWSDDLSGLNRIDEGLRREDERVRSEVSRMDSSRLIVAAAANDAQALAINDRIQEAMTEARSAGELGGFSSLHSLLFSEQLQARNTAARLANLANGERVIDGFAALGFRPEALADFSRELAGPAPGPLTLTEVLQSPLGDLVRPFRADLGQRVGLVTLVRDVSDAEAIRRRLAPIEGAYYFDQEEFLARTYGRYRRRTLEVVSLGILVMFGTVFLKYRRWRPTLAAGLPALVASATTLAILGLAGVVTNVLHVVSLLLVLSAGEDYAVFLIESASEPRFLNASAVSIALCCFATVLGFGLLGLSAMPALRAIGMTTGIGVLISLVLAPTALLLLPKVEPAP